MDSKEILKKIQDLQTKEHDLFSTLENGLTNGTISNTKKNDMLDKINQLTQQRVNLYDQLNISMQSSQKNLENVSVVIKDQNTAVQIVEDQLNDKKKQLESIQEEKVNKLRLIEINTYYSEQYKEHGNLMKTIIFTLIPIIILYFLAKNGVLPIFLYYPLVIIIGLVGSIMVVRIWLSITNRDSMNYQEYDWYFNKAKAPAPPSNTGSAKDPWSTGTNGIVCIGDQCCSTGMTYDNVANKCIASSTSIASNSAPVSTDASSSADANPLSKAGTSALNSLDQFINDPTASINQGVTSLTNVTSPAINTVTSLASSPFQKPGVEPFRNMPFSGLTKYAYTHRKPDVTLGQNVQPHKESFLYGKR